MPDVALSEERETAEASLRLRDGAPRWVTWALGGVALLLVVLNFVFFETGWEDFVFLGVVVLFFVGLVVALNPRRGSTAGGTASR